MCITPSGVFGAPVSYSSIDVNRLAVIALEALTNPKLLIFVLSAAFGISTAYHVPAAREYLPEIGKTIDPPVSNDVHPEVKLKIERISQELQAISNDYEKLRGSVGVNYRRLQAKIDALAANQQKWHGE